MCGENFCGLMKIISLTGSSPRVRGKHLVEAETHDCVGLIPACAGKTVQRENQGKKERAHPRVCGENIIGAAAQIMRMGSSPRVRGKLCYAWSDSTVGGLIPACAGKTQRCFN